MFQQDSLFSDNKEVSKIQFLTLFCDGASRGKPPGESSAGCVLFDQKIKASQSKLLARIQIEPIWKNGFKLGKTTNNWAEWQALILGMEYILANFEKDIPVQVFLDSNLVVEQINQKWQVKNPDLQILYQKAKKLAQNFDQINFQHIFREYNYQADEMANWILDKID
jgi:ribonuclease HI